jgi:hypothetical protein
MPYFYYKSVDSALNKSETLQRLKSIMFQDLALQQGASQLQTASADLWTILVNTSFQLMIYLPLFNPTKFHHYRIVLLSSISLNKGTELN